MENGINQPYKICDVNREKKKGIVASSLEDLLSKVPEKLGLPAENLTVVLECDGTEVDDEEYFSTLDPDTSLMILHGTEKWAPNMPKCQVSLDQTDDVSLGGQDLELLSDMDPDSLADIVTDRDNRIILEHIKEASGRILLEKRQAQDAMELLKLYHQSVANGTEDVSPQSQERV
ncbi:cell death activator CIDE-3-like isoform X2 [Zerene cesonia]|uniref:cell death activator CIDE-3-like isoform X2 n=1 Tax=Zerene cesonia TaxID=33412 RepID=UPI0018E5663F|nr:cell death activator CIDE-3-like isoform X2 [Zerene cesonia]